MLRCHHDAAAEGGGGEEERGAEGRCGGASTAGSCARVSLATVLARLLFLVRLSPGANLLLLLLRVAMVVFKCVRPSIELAAARPGCTTVVGTVVWRSRAGHETGVTA